MAKKTPPKSKPATAKKAAQQPSKKSSPQKAARASAAKPIAKTPAKRTPAKRKSKETAVLTSKPTSSKPGKPKTAKAKPARAAKTAPQAPETYLAKVSHWPQDVIAGLGKMIQKAAPAKGAAAESLGWIKSRATRVKEVGQKELHELVRVAAKLKELRHTPAPATGKRRAKSK